MAEKIIIQMRNVNVAGGDLPDGFSVKLDADVDYTNVSKLTLAQRCSGGSSDRVKQQAVWRKMKPKQLIELSTSVIKLDGATIGSQSTGDLVMNMSIKQFNDSLGEYFSNPAEVITCFSKKHSLERSAVLTQYINTVDNEYTEETD